MKETKDHAYEVLMELDNLQRKVEQLKVNVGRERGRYILADPRFVG